MRSTISPSLPRLRWGWFWHACCIVGTATHVARLHFSGDHLENVWSLSGGTSWSALVYYSLEIRNLRRLPLEYSCMLTDEV